MTVALNGEETGKKVAEAIPGSVVSGDKNSLIVESKSLLQVAEYLKNTPGMEFDYLTVVTAVDYLDYFEVVYRLVSMKNNQSLMLKTRVFDRVNPTVASVTGLWRAAYYQEREIYDLLGIKFEGHPYLKRLLLWEGFEGYPLRRDYL
ncbi:MAG: NADH-quinone oxidoreductase subunit C [Dehalococcoidia bacterium]|nr:NADH-quinone oxidoreductase subunit C [Dehalococcoidia bacterium]MDD5493939.1 NADH-quinone oxidoreductase subunit C [Dehalococcoidia bacterium]